MEKKDQPCRITLIGHAAFGQNIFDGQTTKTRNVIAALKAFLPAERLVVRDTLGGKKRLLTFFFQLPRDMRQSQHMIMMPAHNSLRFFAPLMWFWQHFFHCKLHYVMIGEWLPEFVEQHRYLKRPLQHFEAIYAETRETQKKLQDMGFTQTLLMPNFKNLNVLTPEDLMKIPYPAADEPLKLCIFSRIFKEKGIELAVEGVKLYNQRAGRDVFTLDIYGPVDGAYQEDFQKLQKTFPHTIRYCGVVPADQSVRALASYQAMLFLTWCEGEGFPGTLIDAMAAGLPVIASDWRHNRDILEPHQMALFSKPKDLDSLLTCLQTFDEDRKLWQAKRADILQAAKLYAPEKVIQTLLAKLACRGTDN